MFKWLLLLICTIFRVQSDPIASFKACLSDNYGCVINTARRMYALVLEPNDKIEAEDMDPMYHEIIEGDLEIVKYKLTNTTVKGFKTCEIQETSFNRVKQIIQIRFLCQKFELQGQYYLKGRILSMEAEGNGDYHIETGKYTFSMNIALEGTNYMNIKNFTFTASPLERVHYMFKNSQRSYNESGDDVVKYINKNWKAFTLSLEDPTYKTNLQVLVNNSNKYLRNISFD